MNNFVKNKIKIIKVPGFHDFRVDHFNELLIPPLGIAVISKYLRDCEFIIEQDDLNIKIKNEQIYKNGLLYKLNLIKQFKPQNKDRIFSYLKGNKNKKIECILSSLFNDAGIEEFDMILFSCFQTDPTSSLLALCMAKYVKKINKKFIVVIGGEHHAQQLGPGRNTFIKDNIELIFSFGIMDYYIRGAGEESIKELLNFINGSCDISKIKGLIYKNIDGSVSFNELALPKVRVPDFDGLPLEGYKWMPSKTFNDIIEKKSFSTLEDEKILILPFQFMIGCPNKCIFCECSNPELKLEVQKPQDTVEALEYLSNKYHTKYFFFLNSCVNISKAYINELCDRIIDSKLEIMWTDCARVDNLDRETLLKMKNAGAVRLVFGLESGSERMLKYLNKRINLSYVENVLRWCYEANIWCCLELIPGLPYEREEDIDSTIKFLKNNYKYIDSVFSNTFYLEPNSIMAYCPEKYGLENIRKMPYILKKFSTPSYNLAFDEINGLAWDEKVEQQYNSYVRIRAALEKLSLDDPDYIDSTHVLFYLYSKFSNKQIIKSNYRRYFHAMKQKKRKDIIFYALRNPLWVISRFIKVKSLKELMMLFREF